MAIAMNDAVRIVKTQAQQLFEGEDTAHLMLEEVDFDEAKQAWLVTLGYDSHQVVKTTNTTNKKGGVALSLYGDTETKTTEEKRLRIYKTFQIDASDGRLISMKMRDV